MAKFRFRLETLLKLRKAERDQRQIQFAEAQQAERVIQQQIQSVSVEQEANRENARRLTEVGAINVDALLDNNRYDIVLRAKQMLMIQQQVQLVAELQRRHQLLVEADRQVKTIERLRERKLEEHQQMEQRQEMKLLDEVAQRVYRTRDHQVNAAESSR